MENHILLSGHVKPDMGSEGWQVYGTPDPAIETSQYPPNTGMRRILQSINATPPLLVSSIPVKITAVFAQSGSDRSL
jgi:hypothetical protein